VDEEAGGGVAGAVFDAQRIICRKARYPGFR
jgi:hypothetical protein